MVSILLLAACTPKADAEPTPDTNMVYTQAAQTVAAQLAAQATVAPTLDPNLIRTEAAQTVEAEMAKKATATQPAPLATVAPLNTVAPLPVLSSPTAGIPLTSTGNSAEWRGQWPVDGSSITVGTDVDVQWTLKNTGTKTWTKEYQYRFYLGDGQFHKYSGLLHAQGSFARRRSDPHGGYEIQPCPTAITTSCGCSPTILAPTSASSMCASLLVGLQCPLAHRAH